MKTMIMFCTLMLLVSGMAHAQVPMNTGIRYTLPTQYEDGTALPAGDITARRLYCGTQSGTYPMNLLAPNTGTLISKDLIVSTFSLGYATNYFCVMTVTAVNGLTSKNSSEVSFFLEDVRVPGHPGLAVE